MVKLKVALAGLEPVSTVTLLTVIARKNAMSKVSLGMASVYAASILRMRVAAASSSAFMTQVESSNFVI